FNNGTVQTTKQYELISEITTYIDEEIEMGPKIQGKFIQARLKHAHPGIGAGHATSHKTEGCPVTNIATFVLLVFSNDTSSEAQ
ncbi:MAG: hypothetical protein EBT88_17355, partial [Proteobacteria bacterium]|nr:hypothetical protein [Pseudomonadota bacterium]